MQFEDLNKPRVRVLGPQHPDVQVFITREDNDSFVGLYHHYKEDLTNHYKEALIDNHFIKDLLIKELLSYTLEDHQQQRLNKMTPFD